MPSSRSESSPRPPPGRRREELLSGDIRRALTTAPKDSRRRFGPLLSAALSDFDRAADSLGHTAVTAHAGQLADVMASDGDTSARSDLLEGAADALARRGVLPGIVTALRQR